MTLTDLDSGWDSRPATPTFGMASRSPLRRVARAARADARAGIDRNAHARHGFDRSHRGRTGARDRLATQAPRRIDDGLSRRGDLLERPKGQLTLRLRDEQNRRQILFD